MSPHKRQQVEDNKQSVLLCHLVISHLGLALSSFFRIPFALSVSILGASSIFLLLLIWSDSTASADDRTSRTKLRKQLYKCLGCGYALMFAYFASIPKSAIPFIILAIYLFHIATEDIPGGGERGHAYGLPQSKSPSADAIPSNLAPTRIFPASSGPQTAESSEFEDLIEKSRERPLDW